MKVKNALVGGILALSLGMPSCLGPDNAYHSVKNWNAGVSDQDWVNEGVFLVLTIIPVYGVCLFGDVLIFNTIDYWTGDNVIKDPGAFPGFTSKD